MELFLVSAISIAIIVLLIVLYIKKHKAYTEKENEYNEIYTHYKDVVDLDRVVKEREACVDKLSRDISDLETDFKKRSADLNSDYKQKRSVYDQLMQEIQVLEENLEMTSYGLYQPHYDYDTSEDYKQALDQVRKSQKEMIKDKLAVDSHKEWLVDGSKAKGRQQVNQYTRIMLRAFNGESDAAMAKVSWNNVTRMEERIRRSFDAINKVGTTMHIEISNRYLNLKMDELRLSHEYEQKRYEEKEEQRRIREEMREEERAQRELEKAQQEAEKEELRYEKALEKARRDVEKATGDKLDKLNEQIAQLEQQLDNAHEQKERAISRAQLTKSGYVYVISNIGSFGEDVYKIGMTRRLEPLDRVRELGDASVPFTFDVHAMIFSKDAPTLENTLHRSFDDRRVNKVNIRKEFFNVSLDEIAKVVQDNHAEIEFTKLAEAKEYRETLAKLREGIEKEADEGVQVFPDVL